MSEPTKMTSEYKSPGQVSRTESVELPPVVETGKKHDTKYIRSTVLMLIMFCAGLGWVYFEGRQGTKPPAEDTRVSTVNSAIGIMRIYAISGEAQREKQITPLEFSPTQCQVPTDKLAFNPFEVYLYRIQLKEQAAKPKEPEKPKVVEEKAPSVDNMKLESVLLGGRPSAMITGRTVHVGQKIGGWRVQEIKPDRVILRWKDKTHVLKME